MKINAHGTSVEIYGAETEEQVFQIATTAVAFETLSAKLYSDRVTAIIRELSANAYDAHVDAGRKATPFDIDLPTALAPEFRIRDYGNGMDDDQIRELYCTYFSSSKQRTNKQIGGFGIGSKSPFSYTQGFTVTAFQGGEKRTYSAYINEHRVPAIVRLTTEPTDEKDGLEVKFPVKSSDFYEFRTKAADVFEFFEPQPKINIRDFKVSKTPYNVTGSNWKLRSNTDYSNTGAVRLVQGMIPYRLRGFGETLPHNIRHMLTLPLDIFVPIGTLSPAANRETLTNEKATIDKLKDILTKIDAEINDSIEKQMMACTTGYKRMVFLSTFNNGALDSYVSRVWDKTIGDPNLFGDTCVLPETFPDISVIRFSPHAGSRILLGKGTHAIYLTRNGDAPSFVKSEFIIADTAHGSHQKLRRYMEHRMNEPGKGVVAIFVRELPKKQIDFKADEHLTNALAFIAALGNPPVKLLSEIEIPKSGKERVATTFTPKYWAGCAQFKTDCTGLWTPFLNLKSFPDAEPIYYYMRTHHGRPEEFADRRSPHSINNAVNQMLSFLEITKKQTVICTTNSRKPPRKSNAKWVDLIKTFETQAIAFLEQNPITVYGDVFNLQDLRLPANASSALLSEARTVLSSIRLTDKHDMIVSINDTLRSHALGVAINNCITRNETRANELVEQIKTQYPLLGDKEALVQFYITHTDNNQRRIYIIKGDNDNADKHNDAEGTEDAREHDKVCCDSGGSCDGVFQRREDLLNRQDSECMEAVS